VASADSRFTLRADLIVHDNGDLTIVVGGGSDHAGAVALALPRPSLADPDKQSATSSVLTAPGHKDDLPAREVAEKVAAATGCNVVAVAGIHYDDLEPADLQILRELWLKLVPLVVAAVA
jgi:hypothetical protein